MEAYLWLLQKEPKSYLWICGDVLLLQRMGYGKRPVGKPLPSSLGRP
jgi:hypothetical protein